MEPWPPVIYRYWTRPYPTRRFAALHQHHVVRHALQPRGEAAARGDDVNIVIARLAQSFLQDRRAQAAVVDDDDSHETPSRFCHSVTDRKSTRLNSRHSCAYRITSSA